MGEGPDGAVDGAGDEGVGGDGVLERCDEIPFISDDVGEGEPRPGLSAMTRSATSAARSCSAVMSRMPKVPSSLVLCLPGSRGWCPDGQ